MTDAGAVFAVLAESHPVRRAAFDHNFEELIAAMTYDGTDFLVAEDGGTVIGYAVAARVLSLSANGPVSRLLELVVAAAHRKQGVGGRLVDAIVARARRSGAVEVAVAASGARAYFERRGFVARATYLTLPLI